MNEEEKISQEMGIMEKELEKENKAVKKNDKIKLAFAALEKQLATEGVEAGNQIKRKRK